MTQELLTQKLKEASKRLDDRISKELSFLKDNPANIDVEKIKDKVQQFDSEEKARAIFEYFEGDFGSRLSKDENQINKTNAEIQNINSATQNSIALINQQAQQLINEINAISNDLQNVKNVGNAIITDTKIGKMIPVIYGYVIKSNTVAGNFIERVSTGPRGTLSGVDSGIANNGNYVSVNFFNGHGVTMKNLNYTVLVTQRRQQEDNSYLYESRFIARTTQAFTISATNNTDNAFINTGTGHNTSLPPQFSFAVFGEVESIV